MYSPRSRWERSRLASAAWCWTSRSLRQAIYSGEPCLTLLARQNASSSSPSALRITELPRSRQPPSKGAASSSAIRGVIRRRRIKRIRSVSTFVIAGLDPAIHRNNGKAALKEDGCPGHYPWQRRASRFSPGMMTGQPLPSRPALQRLADLVQHLGVLDGGGHGPGIAVGDILDGAAQDLSGTGFGQSADRDRELERRHRPELFPHQRHHVFLDLGIASDDAGLQHQEAAGHFALDG